LTGVNGDASDASDLASTKDGRPARFLFRRADLALAGCAKLGELSDMVAFRSVADQEWRLESDGRGGMETRTTHAEDDLEDGAVLN
jgi:hypothetical protein